MNCQLIKRRLTPGRSNVYITLESTKQRNTIFDITCTAEEDLL